MPFTPWCGWNVPQCCQMPGGWNHPNPCPWDLTNMSQLNMNNMNCINTDAMKHRHIGRMNNGHTTEQYMDSLYKDTHNTCNCNLKEMRKEHNHFTRNTVEPSANMLHDDSKYNSFLKSYRDEIEFRNLPRIVDSPYRHGTHNRSTFKYSKLQVEPIPYRPELSTCTYNSHRGHNTQTNIHLEHDPNSHGPVPLKLIPGIPLTIKYIPTPASIPENESVGRMGFNSAVNEIKSLKSKIAKLNNKRENNTTPRPHKTSTPTQPLMRQSEPYQCHLLSPRR